MSRTVTVITQILFTGRILFKKFSCAFCISVCKLDLEVRIRSMYVSNRGGVAPGIFRRGANSSNEGAKI